ncbi:uncharacterized protein [Miscanthus floridulus]|uniref:uncharacterized protein n=1 Tax=Miscanthus floridulus TaxID=154761 RepID=UPI00345AC1B0
MAAGPRSTARPHQRSPHFSYRVWLRTASPRTLSRNAPLGTPLSAPTVAAHLPGQVWHAATSLSAPRAAVPRSSALTGAAEPLGPALPSSWSSPQPPALLHWTELSRAASSRQAVTTAPWSAAALLCLTEPHAAPPRLLHGAIHLRRFLSSAAPPARPQRIAGPPVPSSVTASASAPSAADFPPVAPPLASELIAAPSPSSRGASSPPVCS